MNKLKRGFGNQTKTSKLLHVAHDKGVLFSPLVNVIFLQVKLIAMLIHWAILCVINRVAIRLSCSKKLGQSYQMQTF